MTRIALIWLFIVLCLALKFFGTLGVIVFYLLCLLGFLEEAWRKK